MSDTTTAKAASPAQTVKEIATESTGNLEKALKSGIKFQEETLSLWKEMLPKFGSPDELQTKLGALAADAFPAARKRTEEVIETLSRSGKQTLSLCEKAASVSQARSLPEAQRRLRDVTESWFAIARENVRIAADANAKIIDSWKDMVGRIAPVAK